MSTPEPIQARIKNQDGLKISKDINSLCDRVVQRIIQCANVAIDQNGVFHFALAGGSTPKVVFERLAAPENNNQIDWQKTHIWFGDERCVPAEHSDSNYRMANQSLLSVVSIPTTNIHRIQGELSPELAAISYADQLGQNLPINDQGFPVFDLMLQGLGPDGHTASLFPGTPALEIDDKIATAVYVEKMDSWRVSLTFPVLNAAKNLIFLVAGESKQEILVDIFHQTDSTRTPYPVEMLKPSGVIEWYVDGDAATLVKA